MDWESVALLYEGLVRLAPTVGALVGRAAAVSEARGAAVGLAFLDKIRGDADDIRGDAVAAYQPYWAARAHRTASARPLPARAHVTGSRARRASPRSRRC